MKKSDWQYLIDTLLFINILGIVCIGFFLGLIIPKGSSVAESDKYFLGLHRHDWGDIHFYLSIAFTLLLIIHFLFSWKWIKAKSKQIFKNQWRPMLILILFLALLAPLLIWNFWPKYAETYSNYGRGLRDRDLFLAGQEDNPLQIGEGYIVITGQMTLLDLEKSTGIPFSSIIEKLGLPKRTKADETLGQLRRRYGFMLQDVRDVITQFLSLSTPAPEEQETVFEAVDTSQTSVQSEAQKEAIVDEEHEDKITRGRLSEDSEAVMITGQMTLRDIEKNTGIQARRIAEELGLPSNVSLDERIGRLRKIYPITIQDIRDALSALLKKSKDGEIN